MRLARPVKNVPSAINSSITSFIRFFFFRFFLLICSSPPYVFIIPYTCTYFNTFLRFLLGAGNHIQHFIRGVKSMAKHITLQLCLRPTGGTNEQIPQGKAPAAFGKRFALSGSMMVFGLFMCHALPRRYRPSLISRRAVIPGSRDPYQNKGFGVVALTHCS